MTYNKLLALTNALLVGDIALTEDELEREVLLEYGLEILSDEVNALKLLTASLSDRIVRQGPGDTFVRKPRLPTTLDDEIDIDDTLCFPLARLMASFACSKDREQQHLQAANKLILNYNSKVDRFLDTEALALATATEMVNV